MTREQLELHIDGLAFAVLLCCYPLAAWLFLKAFTLTIGQ